MKFNGTFMGARIGGSGTDVHWIMQLKVPASEVPDGQLRRLQSNEVTAELDLRQVEMKMDQDDSGELFFNGKPSRQGQDGELLDREQRDIKFKSACHFRARLLLAKGPDGLFYPGFTCTYDSAAYRSAKRAGAGNIDQHICDLVPNTKNTGHKKPAGAIETAFEAVAGFILKLRTEFESSAPDIKALSMAADRMIVVCGGDNVNYSQAWIDLAPKPKATKKK